MEKEFILADTEQQQAFQILFGNIPIIASETTGMIKITVTAPTSETEETITEKYFDVKPSE